MAAFYGNQTNLTTVHCRDVQTAGTLDLQWPQSGFVMEGTSDVSNLAHSPWLLFLGKVLSSLCLCLCLSGSPFSPLHPMQVQEEVIWAHREATTKGQEKRLQNETYLASVLILYFPDSSTVRKKFLLFIRYQLCGILLWQHEQINMGVWVGWGAEEEEYGIRCGWGVTKDGCVQEEAEAGSVWASP